MRNIKINPIVGIIVILVAILIGYITYRSLTNITDEAFFRGFNSGAQTQKTFDDQRRDLEKQIEKNKNDQQKKSTSELIDSDQKLKI